MAHEPVLTAYLDDEPCPRVEVLFESFEEGTARVTVHRVAEDRDYSVRGAVNVATAGALTRIDFEVPFGVVVTYRAEMFDASGDSLGFTSAKSVTLNVAETWMHNPLSPSGAVVVQFRSNAFRALDRPVPMTVSYPMGRRVGVVLSETRRGLSRVVMDVVTDGVEQADRVRSLLGSYSTRAVPVICVRVGANDRVRIPKPFFAGVSSIVEQDMNYILGGDQIAHAMQGDEVSPPVPGLFVALLRNMDVDASFTTNAEIDSSNESNLAINRRYDLAGAAG